MTSHETEELIPLATGNTCQLLRIRNDFIPNYYLLTFPKSAGEPTAAELGEMLEIGMNRAQQLAFDQIGNRGAFSILYSGYSARRETGWHIHIVLLSGRWKKAWLHLMLAAKNLAQACGLRKDDAPRIRS